MENALLQYGVLGIVALALSWFVLRQDKKSDEREKEHRAERKEERAEWQAIIKNQFEESNRNIKENTSILNGFKQALEKEFITARNER